MRLSNWHHRLQSLVEASRTVPFEWGVHDCCMWSANAGLAITGVDYAEDLRGTYSTEAGAARALARIGGIEAAAARGGPEIPMLFAAEGDIGLVSDGARDVLAVCMSDHWLAAGEVGLVVLPLLNVKRAWRVG